MVGGLYKPGDIRRDSGFTIFYIGINIGAFLASITVGLVAYYYGWHYGFGLAGIGMLVGQIVYFWGQKYLVGIGEFTGGNKASKEEQLARKKPLSKIEKDRIIVLLISFLIVVVFWGAFEQAGGLMNLYTDAKVDRTIGLSWLEEIPAAVFQSLNAGYIIIFGTMVGSFWIWRKKRNKEASSLFKMAVGTIIMGLGYIFMMFASNEASEEVFGKAAMFWIFLAYLFHTIGELSTSPVSLSFITKLAPLKYASIMMGLYFAATGFGNKLAGSIGESAQLEPYQGKMIVDKPEAISYMSKDSIEYKNENREIVVQHDYPINFDKNFDIKVQVYPSNDEVVYEQIKDSKNVGYLFELDESKERLLENLKKNDITESNPFHARLTFEKDADAAQALENRGDGKDYEVSFVLEEEQSEQEFSTFMWLTIFTVSFGLLLILFLKRLKRLTHGAEEKTVEGLEQEGFELADKEIDN
jgi:hypothetical protein